MQLNKKIFALLLSIVHIALMSYFFVSGFLYSLRAVVLVSILIQVSLVVFDGCFITKVQHKLKLLPKNTDFIPFLWKKLFNHNLTELQHEVLSLVIFNFPIVVGLIKAY